MVTCAYAGTAVPNSREPVSSRAVVVLQTYDNEKLDSIKDVTVNAYSGKIFRKNGITTNSRNTFTTAVTVCGNHMPIHIMAANAAAIFKVRFLCLAEIAKKMKIKEEAK